MFGTDEVLVAAKQLLQIDGIDVADDLDEVVYVHFIFDRHEIVYANGAESESLYTGPEALKTLSPQAREEILDGRVAAGEEQVDALGRDQHRAAQLAGLGPVAHVGGEGRRVGDVDELVGGDVADHAPL